MSMRVYNYTQTAVAVDFRNKDVLAGSTRENYRMGNFFSVDDINDEFQLEWVGGDASVNVTLTSGADLLVWKIGNSS